MGWVLLMEQNLKSVNTWMLLEKDRSPTVNRNDTGDSYSILLSDNEASTKAVSSSGHYTSLKM